MKRVVIVSDELGILLSSGGGTPLWSNQHGRGVLAAQAYLSALAAVKDVETWNHKPADLRLVAVECECGFATIVELEQAGLKVWKSFSPHEEEMRSRARERNPALVA